MEKIRLLSRNDKGFFTMDGNGKLFFPDKRFSDVHLGFVNDIFVTNELANCGFFTGKMINLDEISTDDVYEIADFVYKNKVFDLSQTHYVLLVKMNNNAGSFIFSVDDKGAIIIAKIDGELQVVMQSEYGSTDFEFLNDTIVFNYSDIIYDTIPIKQKMIYTYFKDKIMPLDYEDEMSVLVRNYKRYSDSHEYFYDIFDNKYMVLKDCDNGYHEYAAVRTDVGDLILVQFCQIDSGNMSIRHGSISQKQLCKYMEVNRIACDLYVGGNELYGTIRKDRFSEVFTVFAYPYHSWDAKAVSSSDITVKQSWERHLDRVRQIGKYVKGSQIKELAELSPKRMLRLVL